MADSLSWTIVGVLLIVYVLLRVAIAPAIAKRWPGSWADVSCAFVLRVGPDVLGALIGLLRGQGTATALVPAADPAAPEARARLAYEASGRIVGSKTYPGGPMAQWIALPPETKA